MRLTTNFCILVLVSLFIAGSSWAGEGGPDLRTNGDSVTVMQSVCEVAVNSNWNLGQGILYTFNSTANASTIRFISVDKGAYHVGLKSKAKYKALNGQAMSRAERPYKWPHYNKGSSI